MEDICQTRKCCPSVGPLGFNTFGFLQVVAISWALAQRRRTWTKRTPLRRWWTRWPWMWWTLYNYLQCVCSSMSAVYTSPCPAAVYGLHSQSQRPVTQQWVGDHLHTHHRHHPHHHLHGRHCSFNCFSMYWCWRRDKQYELQEKALLDHNCNHSLGPTSGAILQLESSNFCVN